MCPGLWQKKQIGRWRGYGCCLGADHGRDGKSREACVFLRAFWISFETSTSSLDPTSFWNTCCRVGWLVMNLVCFKMVLYLPSLGSPLARQLSMRSSNAATAAYGSNSAGGRDTCCLKRPRATSTSWVAVKRLRASISAFSIWICPKKKGKQKGDSNVQRLREYKRDLRNFILSVKLLKVVLRTLRLW